MGLLVVAPLGSAWARMKRVLFRKPVNVEKWMLIAVCAFLAQCGEGGIGGGFQVPGRAFGKLGGGSAQQAAQTAAQQAHSWISAHAVLVVSLAMAGGIMIFAVTLACRWLGSRGRFMMLHAVVRDTTDLKTGWAGWSSEANSHFTARAVLSAVIWILGVLPALIGGWRFLSAFAAHGWPLPPDAIITLGLLLCWVLFLWAQVLIAEWLLSTFLLPIQYHRRVGAWEAWNIFRREVLPRNGWSIVCFSLMELVVALGLGLAMGLFVVCTCCCGLILLILPFIGNMLMLPYSVWMVLWKVRYLEQLGPAWTMISDRGRCPGCDYDLRETPMAERCPECGMVIPDEARPVPGESVPG